MKKIAFRMDDVGASTKQFEVYSKFFPGNFLFLKYIPPFKAWGPYNELTTRNWQNIFDCLDKFNAKLTIGITAAWVEKDNNLIPFPKKFPAQAEIIKQALKRNLIEIANHGLTHCVVGKHLPRLFTTNRHFHREFWDYLPKRLHKTHLEKSQKILEDYFETKIVTFIPPGNVWTEYTAKYSKKIGLLNLSSREKNVFAFHDREIVLNGVKWLEEKIIGFKNQGFEIIRVKDL